MDLLSQESIDQFRAAMRDVTDTFHKNRVVLRRADGAETELQCGLKPDDAGSYGEVNGERYVQDERSETVERWIVSFNRDYLREKGVVDPTSDELLIDEANDWIVINGKRFAIVKISDKGIFMGEAIMAQLTVQR
jgi:hypothetical protein